MARPRAMRRRGHRISRANAATIGTILGASHRRLAADALIGWLARHPVSLESQHPLLIAATELWVCRVPLLQPNWVMVH